MCYALVRIRRGRCSCIERNARSDIRVPERKLANPSSSFLEFFHGPTRFNRTRARLQEPIRDVVAGFEAARRSSICLFQHLSDAAWHRKGTANGDGVTVRALAYILVGHERHHMAIVRKRLGMPTG